LRLRLQVKAVENRYLRISSDTSCERVEAFFKTKKQPVGTISWRTSMFQIKYNPESIQRMVAEMAYGTFLRRQRERQFRWQAQGERQPV